VTVYGTVVGSDSEGLGSAFHPVSSLLAYCHLAEKKNPLRSVPNLLGRQRQAGELLARRDLFHGSSLHHLFLDPFCRLVRTTCA